VFLREGRGWVGGSRLKVWLKKCPAAVYRKKVLAAK